MIKHPPTWGGYRVLGRGRQWEVIFKSGGELLFVTLTIIGTPINKEDGKAEGAPGDHTNDFRLPSLLYLLGNIIIDHCVSLLGEKVWQGRP